MAGFEDDATTFTRRGLVLGVSQIALFSLLAGRLQYLQVARSDLYATLAEDNRVNVRLMAPPRGQIFDRNKVKLADNDQDFQVVLIPEQAGDLDATVAKLSQLLGFSDRQQKDLLRRARRGPKFRPLTVAENLSWETFSQVNLNLPFLSGVQPRVGDRRIYSFADATAHSVGYVGIETKRDIEVHGNAPSDMVGRSGIERYFEAALRGEAGVRHVEVNAHGRTVRELAFDPGRPGADIELTLDIGLQKFAHERMAGHSGSAIVMDTQTGDLLCMVSTPAFDPNKLSQGVDTKSWNEMVAHERKPLMNKVLRGQYSPGSTFKMLVGLAALETGVITPDEPIECTGMYSFGGEDFHCWKDEGHGPMRFEDAIAQSCDTYYYEIARRLGIDNIEKMARRFNLGQPTGIEIGGEKAGIVPGRDWKRANYDAGWRTGETLITGIGQGFLLVTPLQLAVMTASLANGGFIVRPRLIRDTEPAPPQPIGIDAQHLALVNNAMYKVVNRPLGTAYDSSILINGNRMNGKTGTVQVRRISKDERESGVLSNKELDWHLRDHSLFVGYAPHKDPRYAISIVIEHGGGGAYVAAPIARDIMAELLRNEGRVREARAS